MNESDYIGVDRMDTLIRRVSPRPSPGILSGPLPCGISDGANEKQSNCHNARNAMSKGHLGLSNWLINAYR